MMARRFWRRTSAAAFSTALLAPLLQAQTRAPAVGDCWPADTLAVYEWPGSATLSDRLTTELHRFSAAPVSFGADSEETPLTVIARVSPGIAGLLSTPGGIALLDFDPDVREFPFQLALVARLGDSSATVDQAVTLVMRHVLSERELGTREIDAARWQVLRAPNSDEPDVLWTTQDGTLMFAIGARTAEKLSACKRGGAPLSTRPDICGAREKLGVDPAGETRCFLDLAGLQARVRALVKSDAASLAGVETFLTLSGLRSLRLYYSAAEPTARGAITRSLLQFDGAPTGLLKLWEQAPLTMSDLKLVPENAHFACVGNLDLVKLRDLLIEQLEELDPQIAQSIEGGDAIAGRVLGFSLLRDLLPALGDTWVLYDSPDHGGVYGTGVVLVAEAVKPDVIQTALTRLIEVAKGAAASVPGLRIEQRTTRHGTHDVHYVVVGGAPCPLAPSWCFADGRVVFGLLPQPVALAMNQVSPSSRKRSCLDQPIVQQALKNDLPANFSGFAYSDPDWFARQLYPLQLLGWTALLSTGAPLDPPTDLGAIPTLPEQLRDLRPSVSASVLEAGGIRSVSLGGSPLLASLTTWAGPIAVVASIMVPSLSRARELAKRAVSASNLRQIGMAAHIYANDHDGAAPPGFDALVQGGMIVRELLYSPRHPRERQVSYVMLPWKRLDQSRQTGRAVLAYELLLGDEGTNLLFLDGHVEFARMPAAAELIRASFTELGIPEKTPPEFRR